MKASELDISTVVSILNADSSVLHNNANPLIIKLWNSILTSVGTFKETYQSNQFKVSEKLGVIDGKLDEIKSDLKVN